MPQSAMMRWFCRVYVVMDSWVGAFGGSKVGQASTACPTYYSKLWASLRSSESNLCDLQYLCVCPDKTEAAPKTLVSPFWFFSVSPCLRGEIPFPCALN
jgi:hypothetical protein